MPRDISASLETALSQGVLRPVLLVEINLNEGPLYVWSGPGDVTWNDLTFLGAGEFSSASVIQETGDIRANGVTFWLSGVPLAYLALVLDEVRQGKTCTCWFGLLDLNDWSIIADPDQIFAGRVDVPMIEEGGDTAVVGITVESRLIDLERARERRYTHEDQKSNYPDDKGFEYVAGLQDKEVIWGG